MTAVVWVKCFLLIQNWTLPGSYSLSGPAWTLSVETFFYVLFPFLLAGSANLRPRTILALIIGITLVNTAVRGLLPSLHEVALVRTPDFMVGILFGRLYLRRDLEGRERQATALFYGAFLLTLLVPQFFAIKSDRYGGMMAPLFGAMILALANTDAWPARLLRTRAMVFLGGASYALYLFHGYVLYGIEVFFGSIHRSRVGDGLLFAALASVGSIVLASFLFVVVEEPARAWLRQRLIPRRASEPEPPTLQAEPL